METLQEMLQIASIAIEHGIKQTDAIFGLMYLEMLSVMAGIPDLLPIASEIIQWPNENPDVIRAVNSIIKEVCDTYHRYRNTRAKPRNRRHTTYHRIGTPPAFCYHLTITAKDRPMTAAAATAIPIDTFDDILSALERNPALADRMRQHILTQELQALPAAFARMQDDIVDIKALLAQVVERQDRAEADIVDIKALLAQVVERQDRADADIAELKAGQARLEAGQTRMETDIADLQAGQARMETDIAELKAGQRQTNSRLGNLTGSVYEQRIVRRFRSIARRHLDINDAQVLQATGQPHAPELKAATDHAEDQNLIDYDEMEALDEADIIASGRRRNGSPVFVVVEVSETADDNDIDRAEERAAILQRATQQASVAVVIGKDISDTNRQRAARQEVNVIILGEK